MDSEHPAIPSDNMKREPKVYNQILKAYKTDPQALREIDHLPKTNPCRNSNARILRTINYFWNYAKEVYYDEEKLKEYAEGLSKVYEKKLTPAKFAEKFYKKKSKNYKGTDLRKKIKAFLVATLGSPDSREVFPEALKNIAALRTEIHEANAYWFNICMDSAKYFDMPKEEMEKKLRESKWVPYVSLVCNPPSTKTKYFLPTCPGDIDEYKKLEPITDHPYGWLFIRADIRYAETLNGYRGTEKLGPLDRVLKIDNIQRPLYGIAKKAAHKELEKANQFIAKLKEDFNSDFFDGCIGLFSSSEEDKLMVTRIRGLKKFAASLCSVKNIFGYTSAIMKIRRFLEYEKIIITDDELLAKIESCDELKSHTLLEVQKSIKRDNAHLFSQTYSLDAAVFFPKGRARFPEIDFLPALLITINKALHETEGLRAILVPYFMGRLRNNGQQTQYDEYARLNNFFDPLKLGYGGVYWLKKP